MFGRAPRFAGLITFVPLACVGGSERSSERAVGLLCPRIRVRHSGFSPATGNRRETWPTTTTHRCDDDARLPGQVIEAETLSRVRPGDGVTNFKKLVIRCIMAFSGIARWSLAFLSCSQPSNAEAVVGEVLRPNK